MSDARELPRRVLVAGDGQLGVIAALALRRALPASEVTVLGTPSDGAAIADMMPTALPFTNRFHDQLGIEEEMLVRYAGASHRLAVEWKEWGGPGHVAMTSPGAEVDPALKTVFAREWGGGPRNAASGELPRSINEALVRAGRFMPPDGNPGSPLASVDYALRWNMPAYRDILIKAAAAAGVSYIRGAITGVQPDDGGGISAVAVEGAGPIEADLLIDCTGPQALLAAAVPGAHQLGWGEQLPIRRLVFARPQPMQVSLSDRVELLAQGWVSSHHGRDSLVRMLALPAGADEASALRHLGAEPAFAVPLEPGRLAEAWRGNVVALGDAAASFEPLGWTNLDFAHRQLALLLELLPGRQIDPLERDEFNRRSALMADRARDYVAVHYVAPRAATQFEFLKRSDELSLVLDQFTRRGRVPFFEEAPLGVQEWSGHLHALGITAGEGALARAADPVLEAQAQAAHQARCRAAVEAAPSYDQWLAAVLRPT